MWDHFSSIGFTWTDGFVLALCVLLAAFAGAADYALKRADLVNFKAGYEAETSWRQYIPIIVARIFVSIFAGLIVWLLFVEIVPYSKEGVVRYMIFSIAAGFAAPLLAYRYLGRLDRCLKKSSQVFDGSQS
jgi:hypothetical protein